MAMPSQTSWQVQYEALMADCRDVEADLRSANATLNEARQSVAEWEERVPGLEGKLIELRECLALHVALKKLFDVEGFSQ